MSIVKRKCSVHGKQTGEKTYRVTDFFTILDECRATLHTSMCWCRRVLQVYSILRHVAEVLEYTKDEQLESLYQRTAWVFDEKYKRPGYGAYDVFKQAVS